MPKTQWVSLRDALWTAFQGEAAAEPSEGDAAAEPSEVDKEDDYRPLPGSLLHGLTSDKIKAKRIEFDIALSKAALNGTVHFVGRRSADALPEPLPTAYFIEPCGFNTNGSITPYPYNPLANLRPRPVNDGITWTKVAVNDSEFFQWLSTTFPSTTAYIRTETNTDAMAKAFGSGTEINLIEPSKKNAFSKQEVLKAWLRQEFDGQPVPEPKFECRKDLISRAIREVPKLRGICDEATMKKAIDNYNADIRNNPKQSDRNCSE